MVMTNETIEMILNEIEDLRKKASTPGAGHLYAGMLLWLIAKFNKIAENKKYVNANLEKVQEAGTRLQHLMNAFVKAGVMEPEKIAYVGGARGGSSGDREQVLNGAASCEVMAGKAGRLYDELSKRKDLKAYLLKYKSIGEDVANFVRPYLRYEGDFREIMEDTEFVKENMDKVRRALGGLEKLRRSIKLLLDLGVVPTGYNLGQLKNLVRKELPVAA